MIKEVTQRQWTAWKENLTGCKKCKRISWRQYSQRCFYFKPICEDFLLLTFVHFTHCTHFHPSLRFDLRLWLWDVDLVCFKVATLIGNANWKAHQPNSRSSRAKRARQAEKEETRKTGTAIACVDAEQFQNNTSSNIACICIFAIACITFRCMAHQSVLCRKCKKLPCLPCQKLQRHVASQSSSRSRRFCTMNFVHWQHISEPMRPQCDCSVGFVVWVCWSCVNFQVFAWLLFCWYPCHWALVVNWV